jgi:Bacterial Ig-like domain (group 3)
MEMSTNIKGQVPLRRRGHALAGSVVVTTLAVLGILLAPAASYAVSGTAPKITSASSVQVKAGSGLYFTITTTGSPTPIVKESGALPPGLGFQAVSNGTGVIQGTTPASASGTYTVTITASNGVSPDAVQQLVLSFGTKTTATSLSSSPNPSVRGQTVTYTAKVAPVPDGGTVTLTQNATDIPGCVDLAVSTTSGTATCSTTYQVTGSYKVAAQYSGHSTFSSSSSSFDTQVVNLPPAGYWLATANGHVYGLGGAGSLGNATSTASSGPVVGITPTPDGKGYWVATANGGVSDHGDAKFYGDLPALGKHVTDIVAITGTADGKGYYMVGADGGFFTFGDAKFLGSLPGINVHTMHVVGMVESPDGEGYLLVGWDGGVFTFGNAKFYGSLPGINIHVTDIRGILPASAGTGYVLVGSDGGAFNFGTGVKFYGSLPGENIKVNNIVGIALTPDDGGYWMAGSDGHVYGFGNAKVQSTPKGLSSNLPVAAIAGT